MSALIATALAVLVVIIIVIAITVKGKAPVAKRVWRCAGDTGVCATCSPGDAGCAYGSRLECQKSCVPPPGYSCDKNSGKCVAGCDIYSTPSNVSATSDCYQSADSCASGSACTGATGYSCDQKSGKCVAGCDPADTAAFDESNTSAVSAAAVSGCYPQASACGRHCKAPDNYGYMCQTSATADSSAATCKQCHIDVDSPNCIAGKDACVSRCKPASVAIETTVVPGTCITAPKALGQYATLEPCAAGQVYQMWVPMSSDNSLRLATNLDVCLTMTNKSMAPRAVICPSSPSPFNIVPSSDLPNPHSIEMGYMALTVDKNDLGKPEWMWWTSGAPVWNFNPAQ